MLNHIIYTTCIAQLDNASDTQAVRTKNVLNMLLIMDSTFKFDNLKMDIENTHDFFVVNIEPALSW